MARAKEKKVQNMLKKGAHIHLMGICGTAMASLAGIFKSQGYQVTGSDQNVYPPMSTQLAELGIEIKLGYRAENLQPRPDLVIVGNVISRDNPEAQALLAADIPYTSLPQAMGEFVIEDRHSLVVAGTHGKTTTTSMLTWVAEACGLRPGYLIGGIPNNFALSFRVPQGDTFVIEGDEYDTAFFDKVPKFIHYKPQSVILTSIEFDHADIYRDLAEVKAAFQRLLGLIPERGRLVYFAEDENIASLLFACTCPRKISYGIERGDYQAKDISIGEKTTAFSVMYQQSEVARLQIPMFGRHNVLNALASFVMARELGWSHEKAVAALATFTGVKRRQELIGQPRGIPIIEDFAHHPTAVKLTIDSIRERYPGRKIFAVFEPRSATSRRKVFQQAYAEALAGEHEVILAPAFDQSKISEAERFDNDRLKADLAQRHTPVLLANSVDEIVDYLAAHVRASDVILLMSNGGFGGIYQKLLARLS